MDEDAYGPWSVPQPAVSAPARSLESDSSGPWKAPWAASDDRADTWPGPQAPFDRPAAREQARVAEPWQPVPPPSPLGGQSPTPGGSWRPSESEAGAHLSASPDGPQPPSWEPADDAPGRPRTETWSSPPSETSDWAAGRLGPQAGPWEEGSWAEPADRRPAWESGTADASPSESWQTAGESAPAGYSWTGGPAGGSWSAAPAVPPPGPAETEPAEWRPDELPIETMSDESWLAHLRGDGGDTDQEDSGPVGAPQAATGASEAPPVSQAPTATGRPAPSGYPTPASYQPPAGYPYQPQDYGQPQRSGQPHPSGTPHTHRLVRDAPPAEPPRAPTVEELTAQSLLRQRRPIPQSGWRRAVYTLSAHAVNPGRSPAELRRQEMIARATVPVRGCYRLAVISLKGGVGKTTMTVCLGATLASLRGDRVIAVDANPDRGTLSGKIPLETVATVRNLLNDADRIHHYFDVRRYTSQSADRLEVLASESDPAVSIAFSEQDYRTVAALLERFYNIVLTDCGTGLLHSAMAGVLAMADQIVLVSSGSVDGARSASATLDWLEAHGYDELVHDSVAVINSVRQKSGGVDLDKLEAHFAARCRAVARIPYDPHLEEGAEVDLGEMRADTRNALLELAAYVADGLPREPAPGLAPARRLGPRLDG